MVSHPMHVAKADIPTASNWKLLLVLTYLGIIAGIGVLAFVVHRVANRRRHRHVELLTAATVLWGVVCAGLFIYASTQQLNWSNEQTTLIESGYYDPQDTSAAPNWPWVATGEIAAAYAGLILWALRRGSLRREEVRR